MARNVIIYIVTLRILLVKYESYVNDYMPAISFDNNWQPTGNEFNGWKVLTENTMTVPEASESTRLKFAEHLVCNLNLNLVTYFLPAVTVSSTFSSAHNPFPLYTNPPIPTPQQLRHFRHCFIVLFHHFCIILYLFIINRAV